MGIDPATGARTVIDLDSKAFEAIVARAAEQLVSIRHMPEGSLITTPLMYPSGGSVAIWINRKPPHFSVSDYGFAGRECDLMGAHRRQYTHTAAKVAEEAGVELMADGSFSVTVSEGQLMGAIKSVAGCSHEAAVRIATRLHDRQRADVGDIVYAKLVRLYGKPSVDKHVEFKGASQTDWQIDLVVKQGDRAGLFETVTPWFPAVAATLAKFGDIKLLESPPSRTAVLSSKEGFGTWITALAQNSSIIQAGAGETTFKQIQLQ